MHHWGASPSRREARVGRAATQVEWGGASGALASALHKFAAAAAAVEAAEAAEAGSVGCLKTLLRL